MTLQVTNTTDPHVPLSPGSDRIMGNAAMRVLTFEEAAEEISAAEDAGKVAEKSLDGRIVREMIFLDGKRGLLIEFKSADGDYLRICYTKK